MANLKLAHPYWECIHHLLTVTIKQVDSAAGHWWVLPTRAEVRLSFDGRAVGFKAPARKHRTVTPGPGEVRSPSPPGRRCAL